VGRAAGRAVLVRAGARRRCAVAGAAAAARFDKRIAATARRVMRGKYFMDITIDKKPARQKPDRKGGLPFRERRRL
jgi:hypothetical protein